MSRPAKLGSGDIETVEFNGTFEFPMEDSSLLTGNTTSSKAQPQHMSLPYAGSSDMLLRSRSHPVRCDKVRCKDARTNMCRYKPHVRTGSSQSL